MLVLTLVWRLIADRSKLMELAQAIKARDALATASIRTAIGKIAYLEDKQKVDMANLIRNAFRDGIREWADKFLVRAVGPAEAEKILNQLVHDQEVI
jgi:hypothetical protein